jgi:hypothetical protein
MNVVLPWDALITGVVGVAGIGGTLLAARMTIRAEHQRTMLADKRRIYTSCLLALDTLMLAFGNPVVYALDDPEHAKARDELTRQKVVALHAIEQLQLIAPPDLAALAFATEAGFIERERRQHPGVRSYPEMRERLANAMRADLGESAPPKSAQSQS